MIAFRMGRCAYQAAYGFCRLTGPEEVCAVHTCSKLVCSFSVSSRYQAYVLLQGVIENGLSMQELSDTHIPGAMETICCITLMRAIFRQQDLHDNAYIVRTDDNAETPLYIYYL